MKKLTFIFLLCQLAACSKNDFQQKPIAKSWYYYFKVNRIGVPASYEIQRLVDSSGAWLTVLTVPDTSVSGVYHVALPVRDSTVIRNKVTQGTQVTFFPQLRALQ